MLQNQNSAAAPTWRAIVEVGRYGSWTQGGFSTELAALEAAGRHAGDDSTSKHVGRVYAEVGRAQPSLAA